METFQGEDERKEVKTGQTARFSKTPEVTSFSILLLCHTVTSTISNPQT